VKVNGSSVKIGQVVEDIDSECVSPVSFNEGSRILAVDNHARPLKAIRSDVRVGYDEGILGFISTS